MFTNTFTLWPFSAKTIPGLNFTKNNNFCEWWYEARYLPRPSSLASREAPLELFVLLLWLLWFCFSMLFIFCSSYFSSEPVFVTKCCRHEPPPSTVTWHKSLRSAWPLIGQIPQYWPLIGRGRCHWPPLTHETTHYFLQQSGGEQ